MKTTIGILLVACAALGFGWMRERDARAEERAKWDQMRAAWQAELRDVSDEMRESQALNAKMKLMAEELQRRSLVEGK